MVTRSSSSCASDAADACDTAISTAASSRRSRRKAAARRSTAAGRLKAGRSARTWPRRNSNRGCNPASRPAVPTTPGTRSLRIRESIDPITPRSRTSAVAPCAASATETVGSPRSAAVAAASATNAYPPAADPLSTTSTGGPLALAYRRAASVAAPWAADRPAATVTITTPAGAGGSMIAARNLPGDGAEVSIRPADTPPDSAASGRGCVAASTTMGTICTR